MSRSDPTPALARAFAIAIGLAGFSLPAASSGLILVTAAGSPIANLSRDEAEQLYLGRRTTLDNGTPVTLLDLPAGELRDRFYLYLTGKNPNQIRAHWSRQVFTGRALPPREIRNSTDLGAQLDRASETIGYLAEGSLDTSKLRVLLRLP